MTSLECVLFMNDVYYVHYARASVCCDSFTYRIGDLNMDHNSRKDLHGHHQIMMAQIANVSPEFLFK